MSTLTAGTTVLVKDADEGLTVTPEENYFGPAVLVQSTASSRPNLWLTPREALALAVALLEAAVAAEAQR